MLNNLVIVGHLSEMREENENKCIITLEVQRTFKNKNGEYENDFIECILLNSFARYASEYFEKGNVIGVKGRLQCLKGERLEVVAEKLTFLQSNKKNNNE